MPVKWLVEYWKAVGKLALPYFKHRKIALEEKFGEQIIFRRHDQNHDWIYANNQADIDKYVFGHTYSFHPHQLSDKNELFILIDIDKRNDRMPFNNIVEVTKVMAGFLQRDKIDFLLKYSGNRGFHFLWSLGKIKPVDIKSAKIYQQEHQLIDKYTTQLEEYFQSSPLKKKILKYLPKDSPIFSTNSADKHLSDCILIDKNILRPNAVFRSPWSIHPRTELVSAPIEVGELTSFDPVNFTPPKILKKLKNV